MSILEKLESLRKLMKQRGIEAYIVPTEDFHASEYVGDYFKTREYLSGFTGSAGTLVVSEKKAALWTDGRYFLQAGEQLAGSTIALMKSGQPRVPTIAEYLQAELSEGDCIGFDGRTVSIQFVKKLEKSISKKVIFRGTEDLTELFWKDRPPIAKGKVWELPAELCGQSREEKLMHLRQEMEKQQGDVLILTALDEIAWLLNLRGSDVLYTPVFLAYMIIEKERAVLCIHKEAVDEEIREKLSADDVQMMPYEAIGTLVQQLEPEKSVMLCEEQVNYYLGQCLHKEIRRINCPSPIAKMKAVKNSVEMEHIRIAHRKDGVAVTKFLYWLKQHVGKEHITEMSAAKKLEEFRGAMPGFLMPSFESIMAYGEHGAIVHYAVTADTDVPLEAKGLCLADTGGHYREGTTDITRTIVLGPLTEEEKRAYTLVLRGHLNLAAARFPAGVCGANLDILAREPLWEYGMDYNHGTGHGVGYLLSVHEGPQRIQWKIPGAVQHVPLEEGMVVSNEPGYYEAGKFGIRHENLMLCRNGEKSEYGQFLYLEPLTMVPFDKEGLDLSLMTEREIQLLNRYHKSVYECISPYLTEEERKWLEEATSPIDRCRKE